MLKSVGWAPASAESSPPPRLDLGLQVGLGGVSGLAASCHRSGGIAGPGERRTASYTVYGRLAGGQRVRAGNYVLAPLIALRML